MYPLHRIGRVTIPLLFLMIHWPVQAAGAANVIVQEQALSMASSSVGEWDTSTDVLSRPAKLRVEGVTLEEALLRLGRSANINVGYSPSLLPADRPITCFCEDATVGEAVTTILSGTDLEARVVDEYLVIRESRRPGSIRIPNLDPASVRLPATLASSTLRQVPSVQEPGTIVGRVIDGGTEEPLAVARISITGQNLGSLTSSAGTYQIGNVQAGIVTLTAQLIGYGQQSREVLVLAGDTVVVDFALVRTPLVLSELVVVGYGAQSQATISGSVSQISSAELERNSASTVGSALVGRIQGINTRMQSGFEANIPTPGSTNQIPGEISDGRPGAAIALQIRNMGPPLYVIDGVPTTDAQEFNQLNAADIESISILKDAAAAVYGFRAANGVVLVETKRGSLDAPQVRIDGWYGWQNLVRYNFKDLMTAYEFQFSRVDSNNNRRQTPSISAEELELWRTGAPGYENTDHWALVNTPNAPQFTVNASVSGGMERARYYLSLGHLDQTYNFSPDDNYFRRTNLTANLQTSLTERLTIGTELKGRFELTHNYAVAGDVDPIRTALLIVHSSWPHQKPYTGAENNLINANVRNLSRSAAVLSQEISGLQEDARRQASGNFWAEYRFPFGTTARATVSVSSRLREFDLNRNSFIAYSCNADNSVCNEVPGTQPRTRNQLKNVTEELFGQLTLSHSVEHLGHTLSGNVFGEFQGGENRETWIVGERATNYTELFGLTNVQDLANTLSVSRRASFGGRFDYNFEQKYLVSALMRYDGSYRYAPDRRWGLFPGFSVGWRLTEEAFFQDRFGFINELKLRASWGEAGREQIGDYAYLGGATYDVGSGSVFNGSLVPGTQPRGLPVTGLTWVTSQSSNVGVDFVVLDGKLSGAFDLFERKLTGLPAARTDVLIPSEVGYTLPDENLNSDTNRGIEGVLTWSDRVGSFSYSFSQNFTLSRQRNGFRYGERYGNSWDRYRNGEVGRWNAVSFGYQVVGQFRTVEEIENHPVDNDGQGNINLLPGDLIYKDVNGDKVINALDQRPIGYATTGTPILSIGTNIDVNYRGVGLAVTLAGGGLFSHRRNAATKLPAGHNLPSYATDRWYRVDPYNPQSEWHEGYYPPFRNGGTNPSYSQLFDQFWTTNVWYLRLRRIELSYEIQDAVANRFGMSGVRVYASASNPFSLDNVGFYNHDPEVVNDFDLVYPTASVMNIGVSMNLGGSR